MEWDLESKELWAMVGMGRGRSSRFLNARPGLAKNILENHEAVGRFAVVVTVRPARGYERGGGKPPPQSWVVSAIYRNLCRRSYIMVR